jgi:hypothetical protein
MPRENGTGLDGEGSATRPGRIVEFDNTNNPAIALPHPQAADTAVRPIDPPTTLAGAVQGQAAVRADLIGSDRRAAEGLTARGSAPVLGLCRRLLAAGVDPGRPLCAYRGDMLSIAIRSIREGAALTVDEHNGTRFAKWKPFRRSAVEPGITPHEEATPAEVGTRDHSARLGAERVRGTPP